MQPQLADLPPAVLRALEDLLRRVFRAPHGIDVAQVCSTTHEAAESRRRRRLRTRLQVAVLLSLAAALVLVGWFVATWATGR